MTANPPKPFDFCHTNSNILGGSVGSSSFHFPVVANSIGRDGWNSCQRGYIEHLHNAGGGCKSQRVELLRGGD